MGEDKEKTEALAKAEKGPREGSLQWYLDKPEYKARFNQILGRRSAQFASSLITVANSSALLAKAEPQSLIASGMIAATLDLPIDKNLGFAWIVPYNDKKAGKCIAQFQMGYKGYIQLALRSGQYRGMNAFKLNSEAFGVYDEELKRMRYYDEIGDPIIDFSKLDETTDEPVGYVFAWKLVNGFSKVVLWTVRKCADHAERYSQAHKSHLAYGKEKGWDCRWCVDFDAMALKTVVANSIRRWGIMTVEMSGVQKALEYDQSSVIDIEAAPVYPDQRQIEEGSPEEEAASPKNGEQKAQSLKEKLAAESANLPPAPQPTEQGSQPPTEELSGVDKQRSTLMDLLATFEGDDLLVARQAIEEAGLKWPASKIAGKDLSRAIEVLRSARSE